MSGKVELNPSVARFIEENIDLIELNEWNEVFANAETYRANHFSADFVQEFKNAMLRADIDPYPYLTYIPLTYFAFSPDLEEIVIDKKIDAEAFLGCKKLSKVTLTDKVIYIGDGAFQDCSSLKSIELPKNLELIGDDCFMDSGLQNCIYLGTIADFDQISYIGMCPFSGTAVTSIECSDGNIPVDTFGDIRKDF